MHIHDMKVEVKLSRCTEETELRAERKEKPAIEGTWSKCIAYLHENGFVKSIRCTMNICQ